MQVVPKVLLSQEPLIAEDHGFLLFLIWKREQATSTCIMLKTKPEQLKLSLGLAGIRVLLSWQCSSFPKQLS